MGGKASSKDWGGAGGGSTGATVFFGFFNVVGNSARVRAVAAEMVPFLRAAMSSA